MKPFHCSLFIVHFIIWIQSFGEMGATELCERMYVQTDKQLYLAGEQIHMKLLTLDREQKPLVFSKIAYVELVGDSVARVQVKVAISDGIGEGRISLPVNLPTGYYRLIAYTQYMRNEGAEIFFEKIIGVINTFRSDYEYQEMRTGSLHTQYEIQEMRTGRPRTQNFQLSTLKPVYSTREHGELILSGLPETVYSLSVSIAGKEMIDTPPSMQKKQPVESSLVNGEYLPEYEGHIITGTLINNQTGKAEQGDDLKVSALSFPGKGINFFTGEKNEEGEIRFFTSGNYETKQVATIVYYEGEKYRIDLNSPFVTNFATEPMPDLYIDSAFYDQLLERSVALQATHYFLPDSIVNQNRSEPFYQIKPSNSYLLDEYTRFTTMREVFIEFISSARFRRREGRQELSVVIRSGDNFYYGSNPLVFLDGAPISNHELIYNYDPLLVEYINIYNYLCILGGNTFEGIVELKTYRGLIQDVVFDKSTQIIPYEGPQMVEKFLSPDYSIDTNRNSRIPDGRHTLLWNHDLRSEGHSTLRLPFDTSDLTGDFQATVEGITKEGEIFSTTCFFKVE